MALTLCQALWGNLTSSDSDDEKLPAVEQNRAYINATCRKAACTTWLIDAISKSGMEPMVADPGDETESLQEIFMHMIAGRLDKAVESALKSCEHLLL